MDRSPLPLIIAALLAASPALAGSDEATSPLAPQPSAFGCSGYEFSTTLPAVEGRDGVFFRTFADLRLQHPMDARVMEQMGRLSRALAARGTTLVYVTIPSKSQAMPRDLPERAANYGFELPVAEAVYDDIVTRLRAEGVIAPDIMRALQASPEDAERPLFGADFHWSAAGARLAAEAIGQAIHAAALPEDLAPRAYETRSTGTAEAFSGMRRSLQGFCIDTLPSVMTSAWETVEAPTADGTLDIGLAPAEEAPLDIFGDTAQARPEIVLAGTSFSDSVVNNFPGFLQQYTGFEVVNYAITGGNQFGAMTSYLTSAEFQAAPPRVLIWENPIYNNLGQYGPGPMEELIAAAGTGCGLDLGARRLGGEETQDGLEADLSPMADRVTPASTLMIDFGAEGARSVSVELDTARGITRKTRIERGDRLRATGRFYLDMGGFWMPDLTAVRVRFDRPLDANPETPPGLYLCQTSEGANP